MTQIFREDGVVVPVTAVKAVPNVVTQIKTKDRDGYDAVQVGSGTTKKRLTKPVRGHVKNDVASRWIKEFRLNDAQAESMKNVAVGEKIGVNMFRPGDSVQVVGVSKGKGFQGVVKRHGFKGAPKTHGTKDQVRMPGSIGATGPARVFKGMRMGGRMGTDQTTISGLSVVKVDVKENLLYIKGALPGSINSLVKISGPGKFVAMNDVQEMNNEEQDLKNNEQGKMKNDIQDKSEVAEGVKEDITEDVITEQEKPADDVEVDKQETGEVVDKTSQEKDSSEDPEQVKDEESK